MCKRNNKKGLCKKCNIVKPIVAKGKCNRCYLRNSVCLDCGSSITNRAKYCKNCMYKHRDFLDEKNPRYIKGESMGYILKLATQSVLKSGRRVDICEVCGTTKGKIIIHHKDKNRNNNDSLNLKVLCDPHHKKTHWNDYKVEALCKFCNNKFMSKGTRHKFCSKKCYGKAYHLRK